MKHMARNETKNRWGTKDEKGRITQGVPKGISDQIQETDSRVVTQGPGDDEMNIRVESAACEYIGRVHLSSQVSSPTSPLSCHHGLIPYPCGNRDMQSINQGYPPADWG